LHGEDEEEEHDCDEHHTAIGPIRCRTATATAATGTIYRGLLACVGNCSRSLHCVALDPV
jgi:hypothetical protein